jgi:hypothetical protein
MPTIWNAAVSVDVSIEGIAAVCGIGTAPSGRHAERPLNITEYRSTCAASIEHKAGDVVAEVGADLD